MEWKPDDCPRRFMDRIASFVPWRSLGGFLLGLLLSVGLAVGMAQRTLSSPVTTWIAQSPAHTPADTRVFVQEAQGYYQERRFQEASQRWQEAAQGFADQGDRLNQAMALSNLALSAQPLGQWTTAQSAIAQSLALLETLEPTPVQQRILASTLEIQGQLYLTLGQSQKALQTWQASADIYKTLGDRNKLKSNQINQAQALQEQGLYPRACNRLLDALELKTLELKTLELKTRELDTSELNASTCELSPQQLQSLPSNLPLPLQILGLRSLGNVLRVMGESAQSQQVLLKAGQLAQQAGASENSENLAAIYLAMGNTTRALGNGQLSPQQPAPRVTFVNSFDCLSGQSEKTAREFYERAATCYRQATSAATPHNSPLPSTIGSPITALQSQLNLLSLAIQTHQEKEILALLPSLQTQINRLPPSHSHIFAQLKLAQSLMCLQAKPNLELNPEQSGLASPLLQSCLPLPQGAPVSPHPATGMGNTPYSLSEISDQLTLTLQQAQSLGDRQAEATTLGYLAAAAQQGGNLTEAQRLTEQALQRLSAFDTPELAYLWQWQLGRLYQRQGQPQAAIASYTLAWRLLQSLRQDLVASNPDIQFTFRDRVEPVYRELVDLLLQSKNPTQTALKQARDIIESLQLAELNNFFQEACLDTQPQQVDQLDPSAAVIYAIILPERLAVIVSVPGQPLRDYSTMFTASQSGTKAVEQAYDRLFVTLRPYLSSPHSLLPHQQFYDWLIRPAEADLARSGVKTLVFVLDGILRNVPVAALHDGQHYLIENYGVALTPGLQLFNPRPLALNQSEVLIGGLTEGRQGFPALPGVKQEAQDISAIATTDVLLNGAFTRLNLEQKIQSHRFPIVHLATHGQFSSQAEETYLLTWDELINVKKFDQLLRANEALSREDTRSSPRSPIELLVLSACQTAVGDRRAALGLAGLAVRSGAASTLATLWSVQDESTAHFMTQFYTILSQPQITKAEALRQAQLSLLQSAQYQHPFYWAPFVLVGNWL